MLAQDLFLCHNGGMNKKQNSTLIIGIAIPILMILFVAASIYLPGLFAKAPKYNFLYSDMSNGPCYNDLQRYLISGGKIIQTPAPIKEPVPVDGRTYPKQIACRETIFFHDIAANKSTELSFDEAQNFTIYPSQKSPDGFDIVPGNRGGGFLFFDGGSDYSTRYITGHGFSKKLDLQTQGNNYSYYSYSFRFLGWIIK